VTGYDATESALHNALEGSDIVLIPAGVPRKPGMTRDGKLQTYKILLLHETEDILQTSLTQTLPLSAILQKPPPKLAQMPTS
jgi:malate dehydrogenase